MPRSIFDPTQAGSVVGGLDNFNGPTGRAFSNMPDSLIDGKVQDDEGNDVDASDEEAAAAADGPLAGDKDDALHQIADALDERHHNDPAPTTRTPPDGPG